ncbi:MAG TPA: hypothetical protein VGX76_02670 [Pirellulales bacterium]|jgi:hypothetical protein|nr:hypothetical protein [Pirellulales bacterium]
MPTVEESKIRARLGGIAGLGSALPLAGSERRISDQDATARYRRVKRLYFKYTQGYLIVNT